MALDSFHKEILRRFFAAQPGFFLTGGGARGAAPAGYAGLRRTSV